MAEDESSEIKEHSATEYERNVKVNEHGAEQEHEWLRILYERYSEHFLKDNDRIWTVTSIFIPLSLAGLSSLKDGTFLTTLPLALASIGLVIFWYLTCEKHRSFQDRSKDIMNEIESKIQFKLAAAISAKNPFLKNDDKSFLIRLIHNSFRDHEVNIQKGRELMVYLVVSLWLGALIVVCFNSPKDDVKKEVIIRSETINDNRVR